MKVYQCSGCPYSKRIIRKTKPMYVCLKGEKFESIGGYPCSWIKNCEHHKKVSNSNGDEE